MSLDDLASKLSDPSRIGLSEELAKKLGVVSREATRGRLMAQVEGDASHLGVYLLATYVVDDTDFWGDGEIYWWCIPALGRAGGRVRKEVLAGLPSGAPPHKVGSLEWMTNISLNQPPLLAVIPPEDDVESCVLRVGFYDDDGARADLPRAMTAGLEALANVSNEELPSAEHIITPVRDAIYKSLRAEQDDILVDQEVVLRRGEVVRFGRGMIGSVVNAMARVYYFVRDEAKTEQFGPIALHKGQIETVRFPSAMRGGGRLSLFARGADVTCQAFGDLNTDLPFQNRVIDGRHEKNLEQGFSVAGTGAAKLVAFYTPP
ncbi:MAG: hypothetical protein U0263_10585 [Polyangiaceae bacterium]